jgi:hypothetical protein
MIEVDIIAAVKADSILTTLMGGRIYPNQIPQGNTYPMVALLMNEKSPINGQTGKCMRSFDALFAVASPNKLECITIGERLIVLFDRFYGMLGGSMVVSFKYGGTSLDSLQNDTNLHYVGYEFNILVNIN